MRGMCDAIDYGALAMQDAGETCNMPAPFRPGLGERSWEGDAYRSAQDERALSAGVEEVMA